MIMVKTKIENCNKANPTKRVRTYYDDTQQPGQPNLRALQNDAMSLYNTYFSFQAPRSHKFLEGLVVMGGLIKYV